MRYCRQCDAPLPDHYPYAHLDITLCARCEYADEPEEEEEPIEN